MKEPPWVVSTVLIFSPFSVLSDMATDDIIQRAELSNVCPGKS